MNRFLLLVVPVVLASFLFSCTNSGTHTDDVLQIPVPAQLSYQVLQVHPHDTASFTQGLIFYKGTLYESTGNPENIQTNGAWLGPVDLVTGKPDKKALLPATIFGEGITILNDKIYRITWQNQKGYVYSLPDYKLLKEFTYAGEGWGITNDGTHLIVSNGSNSLSYWNAETLQEIKRISVQDNTGMKNNLNELEFINGSVYANVWQTTQILKIDTATGNVTGLLDLENLLNIYPELKQPPAEVMNGIAWDSSTNRLFITGKKWPKLFELKLN